jgi:quinol monooxygenase YgiN
MGLGGRTDQDPQQTAAPALIAGRSYVFGVLTIVARYRTRPGESDRVAAILEKHVAATRAEPGCVQFDAIRSRENPDEIVLYEKYVDEAAFEAHRKSPHFATYIEGQVIALLTERTWQRYEEILPAG